MRMYRIVAATLSIIVLLIALFLTPNLFKRTCTKIKINYSLKNELINMMEEDQRLRKQLIEHDDADLRDQIKKIDMLHAKRMHKLLDTYNWPGFDLVGEEGSHAAWLLIQHADRDAELQKKGFALIEQAVTKHNASAIDLAYLTDRILANEAKPQRYGTQLDEINGRLVPKSLENKDLVDQLRKQVGLNPLQEYIETAEEYLLKKKTD